MYKVCKTFRIPVGHRLMKNQELCQNIHGHNLKIQIQLAGMELDPNDMVIDFNELKRIVGETILDQFDHSTIFNDQDAENISFFQAHGYKTIILNGQEGHDPTAEVFCKYIFDNLMMMGMIQPGIMIDFVRIWENDDSYAEYSEFPMM